MGRSVSTPTNAEVVAYQHHESYYWCDTCGQRVDDETCPEDFSGHDTWHDDESQERFCDECGEVVTLDNDGHGGDPHIVYYTSDWGEWEDFIYDVQWRCREIWPSLEKIDTWIDREDRAILENGHVRVGVSEYCGLIAVWIVPQETSYNRYEPDVVSPLSLHWIDQIEDKFKKMFGQLQRVGSFSNGNAVYRKVA